MHGARVNVLGVGVDPLTLEGAVDVMAEWIEQGEPHYVCVTGVHGVMESHDDPALQRIHDRAGMVTTDGMPLVWLSRHRLRASSPPVPVERVYGPDLMLRAFARSETTGWRHFLVGSTPTTLDLLTTRLAVRFPRARVVGTLSPPRLAAGAPDDRGLVERIAAAHADVVWVGFSTPKQERWMAANVDRVGAPVMVGVGAAFDFHAGVKRQAPAWMRRSGLEWAYRVASEPRRLGTRYLRNNPRFLWLLLREALADRADRSDRPRRSE
jgi:N-acetylglucosaminyldiphosphoundecaprenol N-acetyl-beta-D-mannosaminyltransferase